MRDYTSVPAEGERNPLEGLSFTLDGQTFRCEGNLSVLEVAELARVAASDSEMGEAAKLGLIAEQFRAAFGPAEYARFRQHCQGVPGKREPTPNSVLLTILGDLNAEIQAAVEEAAGRPTQQPSPSGTGEPDRAEQISRVISLQTGDVTVVPLSGKRDAQLAPATVRPKGRRQPADRQPARRRRTG
jgi:hypothetical protein